MGTMYDRTSWLIGEEAMEKLKVSRVIVFGLGGVGGICTEALARAGVGSIDLVDFDRVDITNLNRQVIAFHSTLGRTKVTVMEECIRDTHSIGCIPQDEQGYEEKGYELCGRDNYIFFSSIYWDC